MIVAISVQTQLVDASSQSADSKMASADPLLPVKEEKQADPRLFSVKEWKEWKWNVEEETQADPQLLSVNKEKQADPQLLSDKEEIQVKKEDEKDVANCAPTELDPMSDMDDVTEEELTDEQLMILLGSRLVQIKRLKLPASSLAGPNQAAKLPASSLAAETSGFFVSSSNQAAVPDADNPASSLAGPNADPPWQHWRRDRLQKSLIPLTSKAPAPTPPPMPADPMPPTEPTKKSRRYTISEHKHSGGCADPQCRNRCQADGCRWCAVHCPGLPETADVCKVHYDFPFRCSESSLWCLNKMPLDGSCIEKKCAKHCMASACPRHLGADKPKRPKSTNKKRGQRTCRPARW